MSRALKTFVLMRADPSLSNIARHIPINKVPVIRTIKDRVRKIFRREQCPRMQDVNQKNAVLKETKKN